MTEREFKEDLLVKQLSNLREDTRSAFSLCCASRQIEAIVRFSEENSPSLLPFVKRVIENAWKSLLYKKNQEETWPYEIDKLMDYLPEEQDQWSPFHVYADHSISSVIYTLRSLLNNDPQEAAWAARRAYEAVDQAAIRDIGVQTGIHSNEKIILRHPLVQRELGRQERDFEGLLKNHSVEIFIELKKRSQKEFSLSLDDMIK